MMVGVKEIPDETHDVKLCPQALDLHQLKNKEHGTSLSRAGFKNN